MPLLVPQSMPMDREFILRNQIAERYIAGRLPLRGAQEFERYCREHPQLIDETRAGRARARRAAAARSRRRGAAVGEPSRSAWWEKLPVLVAMASRSLAIACGIARAGDGRQALRARCDDRSSCSSAWPSSPLDPATSTRTVKLVPSRTAPSRRAAVTIGGGTAQMADLRIDMSWSKFTAFRVTIDRQDQGRVAVLGYMLRDSNGDLRLSLNDSGAGSGQLPDRDRGPDAARGAGSLKPGSPSPSRTEQSRSAAGRRLLVQHCARRSVEHRPRRPASRSGHQQQRAGIRPRPTSGRRSGSAARAAAPAGARRAPRRWPRASRRADRERQIPPALLRSSMARLAPSTRRMAVS